MRTYDVIVAGGGIAGVAAAVAAARNGARTLIVERHNSLGGTMAAGLVGPMMTFHDQLGRQVIRGLAQELVDRLVALGASPGHIPDTSGYTSTITPFDSEYLKLVAQRMVLEAGAEILFQTFIVEAITVDNTVRGIAIVNKGGRQMLEAGIVIDATGDADVAATAGAACQLGRPVIIRQASQAEQCAASVGQNPCLPTEGIFWARAAREYDAGNFWPCGFQDRCQARGRKLLSDAAAAGSTSWPDPTTINMTRDHQPSQTRDPLARR